MTFRIRSRPRALLRHRCDSRFYYPVEDDGPGTLTIFDYRCVLPRGHTGPHQVEKAA